MPQYDGLPLDQRLNVAEITNGMLRESLVAHRTVIDQVAQDRDRIAAERSFIEGEQTALAAQTVALRSALQWAREALDRREAGDEQEGEWREWMEHTVKPLLEPPSVRVLQLLRLVVQARLVAASRAGLNAEPGSDEHTRLERALARLADGFDSGMDQDTARRLLVMSMS